jgi:uncharacterized membrane protein YdjX (TVP38/TMEM64 family)
MASAATHKRDKSPAVREPAATKEDAKKVEEVKKSSGLFTPKNLAIVAVVALVIFGLKKYLGDKIDIKETMENAIAFIEAQGKTAVIWYCALTFMGVICLIPTTPMELAGGFLFSPSWGGPWGVLAFTGAAKLAANVISVLIARHILKDWVNKNMVAKSELLTMVSKAVKEEPWKMAFLVRGSMVPLAVKNYGLGVMDIDYLPIAVCSCIFTNFYAMQNIYMGSTLLNLKDVFAPKKAAAGAEMDWRQTAKKLMPIVFNVVLVIFLVKAIKGQIKKQKAAIEKDLKAKEGKKAE